MAKPKDTAATPRGILRTYLTLTLFENFAASFIWGINTLFLLDAGLTATQAFVANAFFTAGQVLFEVPTGVVADTLGRRTSYLLGAGTLFASTLLYLWLWQVEGPFWAWAVVSMLLGLGFTFFSGATEAWLVDGLTFAKYKGTLESAFGKGEVASGVAMLTGTLAGGAIAQVTNLGVPYVLRALMLLLTFAVAFARMHDVGFTPQKRGSLASEMRGVWRASLQHGFRNPPVRWLMLAVPFGGGVSIYAFYAMQPYLLELHGSSKSYALAGLAAAVVAAAQIVGGLLVPHVAKLFRRRTSLLLVAALVSAAALGAIGFASSFLAALVLLGVWALVFAAATPVRQAFLNDAIPSAQRATVLSTDNLLSSSGGVVVQPALGRVADVWSYSTSYLAAAAIDALALPFLLLARRERAPADHQTAGRSRPARRGLHR
jgi:MFS family permease